VKSLKDTFNIQDPRHHHNKNMSKIQDQSKIFLFAPVLTVGDANTSNLTSTDVVGGDDAEEQGTTEPNA
jgi:hypothetical protein